MAKATSNPMSEADVLRDDIQVAEDRIAYWRRKQEEATNYLEVWERKLAAIRLAKEGANA
jgi:hypothetical protein